MTWDEFQGCFKRILATWPDFASRMPAEMREAVAREWFTVMKDWSVREFNVVLERSKVNARWPNLNEFVSRYNAMWAEARNRARERLDVEWVDDRTVVIKGVKKDPELPLTEEERRELYLANARGWAEVARVARERMANYGGTSMKPMAFILLAGALRNLALAYGSKAAAEALKELEG